jgi:hypothetical protein
MLKDGVISYYNMDGNSHDSAGGHNGADNDMSYSSSVALIGESADFNGSDSSIIVSNAPTNVVSISFWFYETSLQNNVPIIMEGVDAYNSGVWDWGFFIYQGGYLYGVNSRNYTAISAISSGVWHNVILVRGDGTNGYYYFDGVLSATIASDLTNLYPNIIQFGKAASYYFKGYIDEVCIWNRALSPVEVGQVYNKGAGISYPFSAGISQNAEKDGNGRPSIICTYNTDGKSIIPVTVNPTAHTLSVNDSSSGLDNGNNAGNAMLDDNGVAVWTAISSTGEIVEIYGDANGNMLINSN